MTYGAMLPDGWEKSNAIPDHPWICPVRSCRKAFRLVNALGNHFVVSSMPPPSERS